MPTYEYVCTECGHRLEAVQSFSDKALATCPVCQGALRKVFGNVGIVLKGSGFYKTDSRRTGGSNGSTGGAKENAKENKEKESTTSGDSSKKVDSGSKESSTTSTSSSTSGSTDKAAASSA